MGTMFNLGLPQLHARSLALHDPMDHKRAGCRSIKSSRKSIMHFVLLSVCRVDKNVTGHNWRIANPDAETFIKSKLRFLGPTKPSMIHIHSVVD